MKSLHPLALVCALLAGPLPACLAAPQEAATPVAVALAPAPAPVAAQPTVPAVAPAVAPESVVTGAPVVTPPVAALATVPVAALAAPHAEPAPAPQAAPAQEAPKQESPAPEAPEQETPAQEAPAAPQAQGGAVPVKQVDAPVYSIPDIRAHRGQELSYVRRAADRVVVDFSKVDVNADPVLMIGSRPVSRNEYRRRALMYAGGNEIDKHVTHLLTQQEIEKETLAYQDELKKTESNPDTLAARVQEFRAKFELDAAAIDRKYEEYKDLLRQQARQGVTINPGDPDPADRSIADFEASINSSIGMDAYRQLLAADAAFEKVFLPFPEGKVEGVSHDMQTGPPPMDEPRPDWIPQASWDALATDDQGRNLRSFVKTWAIDGTGIPGLFKPSILARVREGLLSQIGVSYFFDEDLPDDIFMKVGAQLVPSSDIWYLVEGKLTDVDNELILRELLTLDAMKKGLTAAMRDVPPPAPGATPMPAAEPAAATRVPAWLDRDSFAKVWHDHEDEYKNTLFPLRNIILFRGYTSLDRYREHYRYRQAYNLWRKSTLSDDEVLEHYQGGGRLFFERGNIQTDISFVELGQRPFTNAALDQSMLDLQGFMDNARADWQTERAKVEQDAKSEGGGGEAAVQAAVQKDERDNGPGNAAWFARVARLHAPPPSPQGGDGHNFQRSQLRMRMAEDELSIFVTGYSLADDVYYHGQKGEVYGPWAERCRQHAWGAEANAGSWAIAVRDFNRAGPVGAFEGRNRDLAYEDFLDLNYFHWAQESLKALLPSVKVPGAPSSAGK